MSVLSVVALGAVACGGGESNATVCANIMKDGQSTAAALGSVTSSEVSPTTLAELHTFAGILTSDSSKASDSSLKTAADNAAATLNKVADDAASTNPEIQSQAETDEAPLEGQLKTLAGFCPSFTE